MDGYFLNMPDPSNESGTNSEEPPDDTEAHRERELGTSPHHRQSASFMVFLIRIGAPEVCRRILDVLEQVLEYMESLQFLVQFTSNTLVFTFGALDSSLQIRKLTPKVLQGNLEFPIPNLLVARYYQLVKLRLHPLLHQ
jgi:hypothetical protein